MSRLTRFLRSVFTPHIPALRVDSPLLDVTATSEELPPPRVSRWDPSVGILVQPGFPVAVSWSAKSGCTTVLKWFLAHNGLLHEALAYSPWVHDYRIHKLYSQTNYADQIMRLFDNRTKDKFIIKVIRDPATRAVSSFLHLLRHWEVESFAVPAAVLEWKVSTGIEHQKGLSFRQFLMFVAAMQSKQVPLEIHIAPQHQVQQDPFVDAFVMLEELSTGLRAVEDRCGVPHIDVQNLSNSEHQYQASVSHAWPTRTAEYPADRDTLDELGMPPAQAFFDPETLSLIRMAYWTDYEAYGHHYDVASAKDFHIGARPAA